MNKQKNPTIHSQHNSTRWRLQVIYARMKQCTTDSRCNTYKWYGGKGIKIAPEWQGGSEAFVAWALANGYERGLWLERKDNDDDYSPANCEWATPKQQLRNTSRTLRLRDKAFIDVLEELVPSERLTRSFIVSVRRRVRMGYSIKEAIARYKPHGQAQKALLPQMP